MASLFQFLLVLVFAVIIGVVLAQPQQVCDGVREGLAAILEPCRSGVSACVSSQNLTALSQLFCVPNARSQFNTFLECQGQLNTDQTFASFCSGESCTREPFVDCTIDEKCYQIVNRNLGTAVYETCQCSSIDGFNQTLSNCSTNCANELQDLVDDLGCCANTIPYALRYSTCGVEGQNFQDDRIVDLFSACNVELPAPCIHIFNNSPGDHSVRLVGSVTIVLLVLVMSQLVI